MAASQCLRPFLPVCRRSQSLPGCSCWSAPPGKTGTSQSLQSLPDPSPARRQLRAPQPPPSTLCAPVLAPAASSSTAKIIAQLYTLAFPRVTAILNRNTKDISTDLLLRVLYALRLL